MDRACSLRSATICRRPVLLGSHRGKTLRSRYLQHDVSVEAPFQLATIGTHYMSNLWQRSVRLGLRQCLDLTFCFLADPAYPSQRGKLACVIREITHTGNDFTVNHKEQTSINTAKIAYTLQKPLIFDNFEKWWEAYHSVTVYRILSPLGRLPNAMINWRPRKDR